MSVAHDQLARRWQPEYDLTFAIIAEAHLCLSQPNCVLSLTDTIELFKLCLVYTLDLLSAHQALAYSDHQRRVPATLEAYLAREVDFHGFDANVLRSCGHDRGKLRVIAEY